MTTIYLMRHGHVDNPNSVFYGPEFQLSDRGRRQVMSLVSDLKQAGILPREILSSPFTRARQTAEIVAEGLGIGPVIFDERLMEWRVGEWFDKPLEAFDSTTHYRDVPPRVDDPAVEPLDVMATRVITVINEQRTRVSGTTGLIVSHREPLVSALLMLQGLPMDTIHEVSFSRACVWRVVFDETGNPIEIAKVFDRSEDL